jgi:thioredoxin-like negative regulator of GroEL
MEPYFNEYALEFKEKMLFVKVNVMDNPFIVNRYGIMATPTFKFFCEGRPIQELVGGVYPPLIKKTIEDVLRNGKKCVKNSSVIDYSITGYT